MRSHRSTRPDTARRKALVEAYKRTPKDMGVYRIINRVSGRTLLAASRDLRARLNRHRMNLRTGTEAVTELQSDWNELGPDAFDFEVLDVLEPLDDDADPTGDLEVLQTLWREKLAGASFYRR